MSENMQLNVFTRKDRYDALVAGLEGEVDPMWDADAEPMRFATVERNVRSGYRWIGTFESIEDALNNHVDQEYAEDWDMDGLYDLDEGMRWDEFTVTMTVNEPDGIPWEIETEEA